jgi:hypothetical protein
MSHFSQLFSDNSQVALALRTSCGREAGMPVTAHALFSVGLMAMGLFALWPTARDSSRGGFHSIG